MKFKLLFFIFIISLISLLSNSYFFSTSDNSVYLPLVYHIQDQDQFSTDSFFIDHLESQPYFLYSIFGVVTRFVDTEFFYFLSYFLTLFLIAGAVFLFSFQILKNQTAALLTSLISLNLRGFTLGGFDLLMSELTLHTLSIPVLILSAYFFIKGKNRLAFIIASLAGYIHIINAILFLSYYSIFLLFKLYKKGFCRKEFIKTLSHFALSFLLLIPLVTFIFLKRGSSFIQEPANYVGTLQARLAHHLFPSTWLVHIIAFIIFFIFAFYCVKKLDIKNSIKEKVYVLICFSLFLFLIGTIFSEFYPIPFILRFFPFRISFVLKLFLLPFIVGFSFNKSFSNSLFSGLLVAFSLGNPLVVSFMLLAVLFFSSSVFSYLFFFFESVFGGIILSGVKFSWFEFLFKSVRSYSVGFSSYIISILLVFYVFIFNNFKKKALLLCVLSVLILIPFNFYTHLQKEDFQYPGYLSQTQEGQAFKWVRENTPVDSLFLSSPFTEFRSRAIRGSFVEVKSLSQGLFDPVFMEEQWGRLVLMDCVRNPSGGFNTLSKSTCENNFQNLSVDKIQLVSDKYGLNYVFFKKPKILNLTKAYEDKLFIIYKI